MTGLLPEEVLVRRGAVEPAAWDDPADTNIRSRKPWQVEGWRRSDPVLTMFRARSPEREACDRLRRDVAIADGLRQTEPNGTRNASGVPGGATDNQMDAIARVRAACRVLTGPEVEVVSWGVVNGAALNEFERRQRLAHGGAPRLLRRALRALVAHYEAVDARPRR